MQDEIWRPCPDFEDTYEVSSLGRVRNRATGHIKATHVTTSGHPRVELNDKSTVHFRSVGVLVARAFADVLGVCPKGQSIRYRIKGDASLSSIHFGAANVPTGVALTKRGRVIGGDF
ncbi:NUMOD4 domain-containing protein [Amycolatopsis methanolica]|uniref:NUMOD4 domain-containing protein n=1 Tax=Amycolatopsis methanolica TaxID=1814 RepID=UPI003423BAF3